MYLLERPFSANSIHPSPVARDSHNGLEDCEEILVVLNPTFHPGLSILPLVNIMLRLRKQKSVGNVLANNNYN